MHFLDSILIFFLAAYLVLGALGYWWERCEWNGGICAKSNKPWKRFDVSSDGARGYTDGEGNYAWITYNVDRIK